MDYAKAFFLYGLTLKICDALTALAIWYGAWFVRFESDWIPVTKGVPEFDRYRQAALPLVLVFVAMFHIVGAYRRDRISFGFRAIKKVVQGSVLATLVFVSILYFLGEADYSRAFLALFLVLVMGALLAERALLHGGWRFFLHRGVRRLKLLLVGSGELLAMYVDQVRGRAPYPVDWVGRLGPKQTGPSGIPYLGDESQLEPVLAGQAVDRVILSYPASEQGRISPFLERLSRELVSVTVLPDFGRENSFTYRAEHELGVPILTFNQAPATVTDRFFKRLFDVVGSLFLIALFAPAFLLISLAVKLTSRGPIFYAQERVGADGKVFRCFKFRSMRTDAEKNTGPVWASAEDDRTTPLGKWLRKTSLDEIPQFFNVLRGDMSLVGPRPERPVFVQQFRTQVPQYMQRHKMKSGITGWAQVNGWRGNTSIEERIKHDLYYITNWSHLFDIKILVLTLFRGFIHKNAY